MAEIVSAVHESLALALALSFPSALCTAAACLGSGRPAVVGEVRVLLIAVQGRPPASRVD